MSKTKHLFLFSAMLTLSLASCGGSDSSSGTMTPPSDAIENSFAENDGVISADKDFYKVLNLASGQRYLIGHLEGATLHALTCSGKGSALTYAEKSGGGSTSTRSSSFQIDGLSLSINPDGTLVFAEQSQKASSGSPNSSMDSLPPSSVSWETGGTPLYGPPPTAKGEWIYSDGLLSFVTADATKYIRYGNGFYSATDDKQYATALTIYTDGESQSKAISAQMQPNAYVDSSSFAAPTYTLGLKEGVSANSVAWNIDGAVTENASLSYTPSELSDKGCGVFPISATVSGRDEAGYYYRETSYTVNLIVASGVIPNSLLTFSDVHEEFSLIGEAIEEVMGENGGRIPSLIVATGDWVNGATPEDEVLRSVYLPQIKGQIGGIDAVYVAGNHESYLSVATASVEANLGADETNLDGIGVIFDSNSAAAKANGKSSLSASGLIVYGINYFSIEEQLEDGTYTHSYAPVIEELKDYLESIKSSYAGELILISSHSGLHALGVDPHSDVTDPFGGNSAYNIDQSNALADLLNEYAENYGMNFSFLFGHNHSKGETEFVIAPGERIYATESFADKRVVNEKIEFSYGHAGYLSTEIGSASAHYSFLDWDDASYRLIFKELGGATITTLIAKR
ncbi:MAG: metallophosphoesterase [Bacilli bacterium]|nr:metallophosphoesterase [Bacilli bacterium]